VKSRTTLGVFGGITAAQLLALGVAYVTKPVTIAAPPSQNGSVPIYVKGTVKSVSASNLTNRMPVEGISLFGFGALSSVATAGLLVLVSLAAAFAFAFLFRRGGVRFLVGGVFALASFSLNWYVLYYLLPASLWPVSLGFPAAVAVLMAAYSIRPEKFRGKALIVANAVVIGTGAELGLFLSSSFPKLTVLALAVLFSLYDFYSVFRGPISRMLGPPSRGTEGMAKSVRPAAAELGPMMVNFGDLQMGLGDVTFYSMMPAAVYVNGMGLSFVLAEILLIDLGVYLTIRLLKKIRPLPGLPIPLLLGALVLLF